MCLALPARVVSIDGMNATIDMGGVKKTISIALVPDLRVDDYAIVHVGHAIGTVNPEEAAKTLELFAQMQAAQGSGEGAAIT